MGGGGLACSTAMNAPNSLPVLHRWCLAACLKFKFMSRRQPWKAEDVARASQSARQPDRQALLMETLLLFPTIDNDGAVHRKDTGKLSYMQMYKLSPEHKKIGPSVC